MSEAFGSWQLEALVAVGGLGEVWRGRRGDTVAAVKRLHTHLARNEDGRAQFAVEQRLATTLPPHPSLIKGLEAGEVDGRPYVVLELVEGEDLRRILVPPPRRADEPRAEVTLPRARALAIVAAAADAAAHLHAEGWIHGDICPGNILVENQRDRDRIVLIDLGVARAAGQSGAVRGTHAYMAPEQVRAEAWTTATDVFALGVILWELLAGKRLFHRGPPWLTMAAVVEQPVPPLSDPADALLASALHKDPGSRLSSAAELASRIRSL